MLPFQPKKLILPFQPKKLILPRRRSTGPEPITYVPSTKALPPTSLPVPKAVQVPLPSFRDYVMMKRAESAHKKIIEVPKPGSYHEMVSTTPDPSVQTTKTSEHNEEQQTDSEVAVTNDAVPVEDVAKLIG